MTTVKIEKVSNGYITESTSIIYPKKVFKTLKELIEYLEFYFDEKLEQEGNQND